jgi:1-deoxy-D-xylulose-5-phosphate reductoisomerase
MRLPIALALAYPERLPGAVPPTRFHEEGSLELHPLDQVRFPAVRMCREAVARGAPYPAVLNAANEEAVAAFLAGGLRFCDILALVQSALDAFDGGGHSMEEIVAADARARAHVRARLGKVRA